MGAQLKALLASERVLRVFALGHLCSPKLVEMIGWGGGVDTFVRLNAPDYATVMRALEAGAGGVMASMVRSARQAEEIVSWAKFHPRGCRGVNGTGADGRY